MKKVYLLFFLLSSIVLSVSAKTVEVNYAKTVAQNFYQQTTGKTLAFSLAYQCLNTDATNGLAIGEPVYYVFNAEGNNGFVMVSAEDVVKPVLGYNTTGQFVLKNAPGAITGWFDKYTRQIAYVKVNNSSATKFVIEQWNNYYNNVSQTATRSTAVGPLLTTTWDQDLYYNDLCPADNSSPYGFGGRVPTGCGATAMAQIMRYWSFPAQGTGSNSYNSNYGTLSANFGATTYNWSNMPNSVNSANNDVATIMYDCGVAVDMIYAAQVSGSYLLSSGVPASCQAAYSTYFGYDGNSIQGVLHSNYNNSDWSNLILNELNNGRPIQYAGTGPDGGHTWVLDGTDGNGNFHLNWGWSGTDNGYYSIDALDPAPYANGTYDAGEEMLIGIQPLNITPATASIDLYAAISVTPNPINFLQAFTVTTNVINSGTSGFNGAYCAALFDASGTFIRYIGPILYTSSALPANNYYNGGLTFSDTSLAITVPGTYTIGVYYQPTGTTTWTLATPNSFTNPISVTISGPGDIIALASDITSSPTTFVQGQAASVNVNLVNNGTSTYYGQYEAVLLDLEGNFVEQIGVLNESNGLQAGYSYNSPYLTFNTNQVTAPEGQYILAIAENASQSNNWYYCGGQTYQNPVLIYVVNPGILASVSEVPVGKLSLYPNPASDKINIDASEVRGKYSLLVYNSIGQQVHDSNGVLEGQKLSLSVSDFAAGIYAIQLKTESGILNSKFMIK